MLMIIEFHSKTPLQFSNESLHDSNLYLIYTMPTLT